MAPPMAAMGARKGAQQPQPTAVDGSLGDVKGSCVALLFWLLSMIRYSLSIYPLGLWRKRTREKEKVARGGQGEPKNSS